MFNIVVIYIYKSYSHYRRPSGLDLEVLGSPTLKWHLTVVPMTSRLCELLLGFEPCAPGKQLPTHLQESALAMIAWVRPSDCPARDGAEQPT